MAYMDQANKKRIAGLLKDALKGVDIKYTLSVHNHMTLKMTITSCEHDFAAAWAKDPRPGYDQSFSVNHYWLDTHYVDGPARDVLKKIVTCMMTGNHNNSDIQTDYFDVGWYIDISVGSWKKPFVHTGKKIAQAA